MSIKFIIGHLVAMSEPPFFHINVSIASYEIFLSLIDNIFRSVIRRPGVVQFTNVFNSHNYLGRQIFNFFLQKEN